MIVAAFDPSSVCCGYAFAEVTAAIRAFPRIRYLDCGTIKPKATKDNSKRIGLLCSEVAAKIVDARDEIGAIDHAVVEVPCKPQARQASRKALATYMRAVGAVEATVHAARVSCSIVDPNDWARAYRSPGMEGKTARQQQAAILAPGYDAGKDKGGDCADAICLLEWWVRRRLPEVVP